MYKNPKNGSPSRIQEADLSSESKSQNMKGKPEDVQVPNVPRVEFHDVIPPPERIIPYGRGKILISSYVILRRIYLTITALLSLWGVKVNPKVERWILTFFAVISIVIDACVLYALVYKVFGWIELVQGGIPLHLLLFLNIKG